MFLRRPQSVSESSAKAHRCKPIEGTFDVSFGQTRTLTVAPRNQTHTQTRPRARELPFRGCSPHGSGEGTPRDRPEKRRPELFVRNGSTKAVPLFPGIPNRRTRLLSKHACCCKERRWRNSLRRFSAGRRAEKTTDRLGEPPTSS